MLLFSIITAVRNAGATVGEALDSLAAQTGVRVEHLLIDGASADGTLSRLECYRAAQAACPDRRIRIVSEPDTGLYDALNKGMALATGEVVGVLHADDRYAAPDVLAAVAAAFREPAVEAVYGDLVYVWRTRPDRVMRYWRSGPYDRRRLAWGWLPPHPALFIRRTACQRARMESGGWYDTTLTRVADCDFMERLLGPLDVRPAYVPRVLVSMRTGGLSAPRARDVGRVAWEDWLAMRRNRVGGLGAVIGKKLRKLPQFWRREQ